MRHPRCWREVAIRGGSMTIMAAISYFILGAAPWVWLIPLAIAALVLLKWALRPEADEYQDLFMVEEKTSFGNSRLREGRSFHAAPPRFASLRCTCCLVLP